MNISYILRSYKKSIKNKICPSVKNEDQQQQEQEQNFELSHLKAAHELATTAALELSDKRLKDQECYFNLIASNLAKTTEEDTTSAKETALQILQSVNATHIFAVSVALKLSENKILFQEKAHNEELNILYAAIEKLEKENQILSNKLSVCTYENSISQQIVQHNLVAARMTRLAKNGEVNEFVKINPSNQENPIHDVINSLSVTKMQKKRRATFCQGAADKALVFANTTHEKNILATKLKFIEVEGRRIKVCK